MIASDDSNAKVSFIDTAICPCPSIMAITGVDRERIGVDRVDCRTLNPAVKTLSL